MGRRGLLIFLCFCATLSFVAWASEETLDAEPELGEPLVSDVLTLDVTNFTAAVEKYDFLLVEFYAPWCGHCKKLAPEYEVAATELKTLDPPIILAKVDLDAEENKPLAAEFDIKGFPTLKVFRKKGEVVLDYKGPRVADGIVSHLKKLSGPPSLELTSAKQVEDFLSGKEGELAIVGVFSALEGEEYSNYTHLADLLRSDYAFAHTVDGSLVPELGVPSKTPSIRLYKNFDEGIAVYTKFSIEDVSNWIEGESVPLVTEMSQKPEHRSALMKFFSLSNDKVFLLLPSPEEGVESPFAAFLSSFSNAAKAYKPKGLVFLFSTGEDSTSALKYFGLETSDTPAYIIQGDKAKKYISKNVEPEQLTPWLDEYLEGKLKPHIKSDPIPLTNDEPVKVIVADSIQEAVIKSGKDVLLEFYAPWCGHCKKLAPVLDEVAISFESDQEVVIAKFDATTNDVPGDLFEVNGFPTLYLYNAKGLVVPYEGDRTKEDLILFINANRANPVEPEEIPSEGLNEVTEENSEKDEL